MSRKLGPDWRGAANHLKQSFLSHQCCLLGGQWLKQEATDSVVVALTMFLESHHGTKCVETSMVVQAMNKHGAGQDAYENMLQDMTGSSSVEWGAAYLSGSDTLQQALIEKAAAKNNMSASDVNLFLDAFMK